MNWSLMEMEKQSISGGVNGRNRFQQMPITGMEKRADRTINGAASERQSVDDGVEISQGDLMGPAKKSRSVNKRFSYGNEIPPTKDADNTYKKNQRVALLLTLKMNVFIYLNAVTMLCFTRIQLVIIMSFKLQLYAFANRSRSKKKLSDMLGPHWSKEELEHFYEAYRKHGRDWKKVAAVLHNRSMEMVEAVYSLNRAYLSLPEGTASVAGFIAMMTDYYSNMTLTFPFFFFPPNFSYNNLTNIVKSVFWNVRVKWSLVIFQEEGDSEQETNNGVGTSRKPKKRLQVKVNETIPKASVDRSHLHPGVVLSDHGCMSILKKKRSGGTRPRVVGKRTPRFPVSHSYENVKGEKTFLPLARKGVKLRGDDDEDVAHSIAMALAEASKRGSSPNRRTSTMMSSPSQSPQKMYDESDVGSGYGDDIEGSIEADNTDFSRVKSKERIAAKGSQVKKPRADKKENKHLDYIREACSDTEEHNLSTLTRHFDSKPSKSSQGSKKRSKGTCIDRDDNSAFDALETLANLSLMISPEADRNGKDELIDDSHLLLSMPPVTAIRQGEKRKSSVPKGLNRSSKDSLDDTKDSHHLITKVSRKRQKILAPKIPKAEPVICTTAKDSVFAEAADAMSKGTCTSQLGKNDENGPSSTKVRSKHKLFKSDTLFDTVGGNFSQPPVKLSNSLSNKLMRRWCECEFFYSAIDDPWFAKQEFVEYLYHVGLGHVPRLTRVEWGVIRSSLGKPRRFSPNFLKEEKEKLNQYQDSVRTHYTELRSGSRDGLPTDLARPLSVGQRVIAIYPKTREIHDGTVLTVDHDRCRVQFDRPELGVEKIMDTDCMPLNPFENMPASMMRQTPVGKFLNEVKMNGQRFEGYTNDVKSDLQSRNGNGNGPHILSKVQAQEADVEAIAELTRALDKKEAVVYELRRMNDDVLENQRTDNGDFPLQDSDAFRKQYAAVLVQLNEANSQARAISQRNTYQSNFQQLPLPTTVGDLSDHGANGIIGNSSQTEKSKSQVNEIVEISRTKSRTMVDIAIQAMSSLKLDPTVEIDKAVDYVNDWLPLDDNFVTVKPPDNSKSTKSTKSTPVGLNKPSLPSELITQCVATLFIIQKCTERQFPPAEVASILDSAVSSLQPRSPQNIQVYADIQKCMGIIKNQILALVPT
ncbi:hypothetical protein LXL04_005920 [Taraxacum kok-saghyz]